MNVNTVSLIVASIVLGASLVKGYTLTAVANAFIICMNLYFLEKE